MREHIFISIFSIIFDIILPPIIGALIFGLMAGKPLLIFYPAVFMVAFFYAAPLGLIGSIILVILACRDIKTGKLHLSFMSWLKKYLSLGVIIGAILPLLPVVLIFSYEQSFPKDISLEGFTLNAVGIVTGGICATLFVRIWYIYGLKKGAYNNSLKRDTA